MLLQLCPLRRKLLQERKCLALQLVDFELFLLDVGHFVDGEEMEQTLLDAAYVVLGVELPVEVFRLVLEVRVRRRIQLHQELLGEEIRP